MCVSCQQAVLIACGSGTAYQGLGFTTLTKNRQCMWQALYESKSRQSYVVACAQDDSCYQRNGLGGLQQEMESGKCGKWSRGKWSQGNVGNGVRDIGVREMWEMESGN